MRIAMLIKIKLIAKLPSALTDTVANVAGKL